MARSTLCSKCKQEKEPECANVSYCKSCKTEWRRSKGIQERIPSGKPPRSAPKRLDCTSCGAIKDNPKQIYCNKCRSEKNKKWALAAGRVEKHQTGLCPCGAERAPGQTYFCLSCKAADSRRFRAIHQDAEASRSRYNAWYQANKETIKSRGKTDFMYALKKLCRSTTNNAIVSGLLFRQPCEVCNSVKVQAHHDDYLQPLEVRWLCKKHHDEHHINERENLRGMKK